MEKRLIFLISLFGCAGVRTPQPDWHSYRDVEERNHIYNMDIEKLSLAGENLTEYYYCFEHERLEEIQIVFDTSATRYSEESHPRFRDI
tara:strand:- start:759 stop:1025 length:267 start_codon:yes stop_codon:yes gene_type:complete